MAFERVRAAYQAFRDPDLLNARAQAGGPMLTVEIPENPRERYAVLDMYKDNTVYQRLQHELPHVLRPEDFEAIRALENPALQAVQFGVMHVFSGNLDEVLIPVSEGSPKLVEACKRVLEMGNMAAQKDSISDDVYSYGDVFLKAVASEDRQTVYPDSRFAGEVTEFREDARRNIVYIRLDLMLAEDDERPENYENAKYWTEVWDKANNSYLAWYHNQGLAAKLAELGEAWADYAITDFGHDFVPFVRAPFEAGTRPNRRSRNVFELHLEAIAHINRVVTELDDAYREHSEGLWGLFRNESGMDAVEQIEAEEAAERKPEEGEAHGRRYVSFGGLSSMSDMVPNIDYEAGLHKIADRRDAIERSMAELRYFRGIEGGDPAAAAIRQHQAPAIKRAEAAKGNAEDALIRVIKMCISMGQALGIFGSDLGTFDSGNFDTLGFAPRAIMPETPTEKAERQMQEAQLLREYKDLGIPEVLEQALIERGYSEADAKRMARAAQQTESRRSIGSFVNNEG